MIQPSVEVSPDLGRGSQKRFVFQALDQANLHFEWGKVFKGEWLSLGGGGESEIRRLNGFGCGVHLPHTHLRPTLRVNQGGSKSRSRFWGVVVEIFPYAFPTMAADDVPGFLKFPLGDCDHLNRDR